MRSVEVAVALPNWSLPLSQPQQIVDNGYWLRPGPNCQVVIAYTGAIAPGNDCRSRANGRGPGEMSACSVTSGDRLKAAWTVAQRAGERGLAHASSHIERLFADVPSRCGIVTVLDGHPATLAWLGAVSGNRVPTWRGAFRPDRIAG